MLELYMQRTGIETAPPTSNLSACSCFAKHIRQYRDYWY